MSSLAPTLEAFFTDRLLAQRQASPNTVACYRDTFRLLLAFVHQQTGTPPSRLAFEDLDASTIAAFLDHLEHSRGSSARTRNTRLAAVRSFFRYAALRHPEHAGLIQRVLAIPSKRQRTALVTSSTAARSPPCSEAPTAPPGPAAATTRCSWSQSKPASASPN